MERRWQVGVAQNARDAAILNTEDRGDRLGIGLLAIWGRPAGRLLNHHYVAAGKDAKGLHPESRAGEPIAQQISTMA
jgi:hypothetical protein